jgi:hypothetical protein
MTNTSFRPEHISVDYGMLINYRIERAIPLSIPLTISTSSWLPEGLI